MEILNKLKSKKIKRKVYWLLRGDYNVASSRLQGYLIHSELNKYYHDKFVSEIILAPPFWLDTMPWTDEMYDEFAEITKGQIVVFQKMFGEKFIYLAQKIRDNNGIVIFVNCDLDEDNKVPFFCNTLVVPSTNLANWYKSRGLKDVRIIDDPIENLWDNPRCHGENSNFLNIGWVGHKNNWQSLEDLKIVLGESEFSDIKLITVSNHKEADVKWSLENVNKTLHRFDIAVIPIKKSQEVDIKSSNRLTLFMGAGIPVIAGNLNSYEEIIRQGINGYIFTSREELRQQLRALRNPILRLRIGKAGFITVKESHSIKNITAKWIDLISSYDTYLATNINALKLVDKFKFKNTVLNFKLAKKRNPKNARLILNDLFLQSIKKPSLYKLKYLVTLYLDK